MFSRSSNTSRSSSRTSGSSRASRRDPVSANFGQPTRPTGPASVEQRTYKSTRSLRDMQEEIEACELELREVEERKQQALAMAEEAEILERRLAEARNRAHRTRAEALAQRTQEPVTSILPIIQPQIIERAPEFSASDEIDSACSVVDIPRASSRRSNSTKSKKGSTEVVGIVRPARPKTIWGGPAWS